MSMFRSPTEIPSFDSDSNDGDDEVIANEKAKPPGQPLIEDDETVDDNADIKDLLNADTESHSNLMTAALLEFYCLTRAADILNRQHGSSARYTRDSPEVQFLGKKMYAYKSNFLSSHGVLQDGVDTDKWGSTRQYYRDNLDALGLSALEGLNLGDSHARPAPIRATSELVLASKTKTVQTQSTKEVTTNLRLEGRDIGPLDFRRPGAHHGIALEDFRLDPRRIPRPLLPMTGTSPTSFPLFDANPTHSTSRLSRYAVEFSEIRILGRGSFGEVYHVKNHMDGQDYAVKKIPLSQKRLEQLQRGNENQLENIMKEIRTLARLEHANVVRYFGAWLEQTHFPRLPFVGQNSLEKIEFEQTKDQSEGPDAPSVDDSFGIVFEASQDVSHQPTSTEDESVDSHSNREASHSSEKPLSRSLEDDVESIPRNFDEPTYSQLSTFSGTDGDIFTDGFSNDQSRLQLQRKHRPGDLPAVVLHIQMSLHPIPLSSYLRPQQSVDVEAPLRHHCYHLLPSLKLILNIIAGVDYLHSKGIVHRDLKPANIFLSCSDDRNFKECLPCKEKVGTCSKFSHPRIGDFGLVADISHLNDSVPGAPVASDHPQKINRVVGTEFYCPPFFRNKTLNGTPSQEELFDYAIDESLDVYALGVILFELVYRLNTKMERQLVLTELTRGLQRPTPTGFIRERPVFPSDFDQKVDHGEAVLPSGLTVAEALKTCIRGMLELQPQLRWRCCNVQRYLQGLADAAQSAFEP
ncbi:kinase-like domain-containing protein [Aspergillus pseudodeflectus]|uniref:Kinase-like domain-containing protein n=1 Tax=Aspergillus pseudodeflectus TaxID=176178 RepID=A0ABR4KXW7_9EURO